MSRATAQPTLGRIDAAAPVPGSAVPRPRTGRVRLPLNLVAGVVIVGLLIALSLVGPAVYPVDPLKQDLPARLAPPVWAGGSWDYPLGTNGFGQDTLSRLLHGGRISIGVATVAIVVAAFIGVPLGLAAGYLKGRAETVIMRLADAQQALPGVLLAIIIVAVVGTSIFNLVIVLAISVWSVYTRLVYGVVRGLRTREFVVAAETVGLSPWRIMARHVLPNTMTPILVLATLQVARMIQAEAALSFLGLGVPPPEPSWGSMLNDGQKVILTTPWLATIPGVVIMIVVLGVNLLGDGLRRVLDPRLRGG